MEVVKTNNKHRTPLSDCKKSNIVEIIKSSMNMIKIIALLYLSIGEVFLQKMATNMIDINRNVADMVVLLRDAWNSSREIKTISIPL